MGLQRMGGAPNINQAGIGSMFEGLHAGLDEMTGGWMPGGDIAPGILMHRAPGPKSGPGSPGGAVLSGQMPITTQVHAKQITVAPPGYIKVKGPRGKEVAMLKVVAYALGLRKRPTRRGGISGKDLRTAERVQSLMERHTVARRIKGAKLSSKGKR